jgi:hypothetical protein
VSGSRPAGRAGAIEPAYRARPKIKGIQREEKEDLPMIDHDDNVIDLNAILHPGSVYDHPRDVVADPTISTREKRAILASWASDAAAVASNPALRELPGSRRTVSIDEVLEALAALDIGPKGPPGGKPNRIKSTVRTGMAA